MNIRKQRNFNAVTLLIISLAVYAILAILMYVGIIDEYNGGLLTLSGIYVIVSLSLNLITGFTGQLALGQAGFMCIGAYMTAISVMLLNIPLFFSVLIGGMVTSIFALLIGLPTLRLRGDYLAIVTLGFGEIIRVLIVNLDSLTGGAAGLKGIPPFSNSDNFVLSAVISFTWVFGFGIFVIVVLSNLIKSSHGRAIISIREDEIAANSMGINVPFYKMMAFTFSGLFAGIGGGLYAAYMGYLNPAMFQFMNSANFVIIIVLGGLGSITGTIIASIGFVYIQEWLRIFGDFRMVIFALALIVTMLFWPKGLMGSNEWSPVRVTRKLLAGEYSLKKMKDGILRLVSRASADSKHSESNREVQK